MTFLDALFLVLGFFASPGFVFLVGFILTVSSISTAVHFCFGRSISVAWTLIITGSCILTSLLGVTLIVWAASSESPFTWVAR